MKGPDKKPTVKLIDEDGNIFGIMGKTKRALTYAGADKEYTNAFLQDIMSSDDYDHALQKVLRYVDVL